MGTRTERHGRSLGEGAGLPLRPVTLVFFLLSVIGSYLALAWDSRAGFLLDEVVHESGHRTLLQTIFYLEHALRELPLDLFLGVALGAGIATAHRRAVVTAIKLPLAWGLGAAALVLVLGGTFYIGGLDLVLRELAQNQTRPGSEAQFGAHWQYHLLSRLGLVLLGLCVIRLSTNGAAESGLFRVLERSLIGFALITLVFQPDAASFLDARYLGHQARELMTHTLMTLPAVFFFAMPRGSSIHLAALRSRFVAWTAIPALGIGVWLGLGVLLTGAMDESQDASLARIIGGHFFEHSLSLIFVPSTALITRHLLSRRVG